MRKVLLWGVIGAGVMVLIVGTLLAMITLGWWVELEARRHEWPRGLAAALLAAMTIGALVGGLGALDRTDD